MTFFKNFHARIEHETAWPVTNNLVQSAIVGRQFVATYGKVVANNALASLTLLGPGGGSAIATFFYGIRPVFENYYANPENFKLSTAILTPSNLLHTGITVLGITGLTTSVILADIIAKRNQSRFRTDNRKLTAAIEARRENVRQYDENYARVSRFLKHFPKEKISVRRVKVRPAGAKPAEIRM